MLNIGTIVYFRDEGGFKIRKPPLEKMLRVLEPLKIPVHIIAQGWSPEWVKHFKDNFNVIIDEFEKPLGCAPARQVLFRKCLYETNADFLFNFDSDVVLQDLYGILGLLEIAHKTPERLENYDLIQGKCPQFVGFKKINIDNRELVERSFTFENGTRAVSQIYLLRNLKKFKNTEIYTQDDFIPGQFSFEDIHFFFELMVRGFRVATCSQMIYVISDNNQTTIVNQDGLKEKGSRQKNRIIEFQKNADFFKLGSPTEVRRFFRGYNKSFEKSPVPRLIPHTFTEYELQFKPRKKK